MMLSSRQLPFYFQEINCVHVTYSTIRLPPIMWVEPHDNEVAADKQVKHNTA